MQTLSNTVTPQPVMVALQEETTVKAEGSKQTLPWLPGFSVSVAKVTGQIRSRQCSWVLAQEQGKKQLGTLSERLPWDPDVSEQEQKESAKHFIPPPLVANPRSTLTNRETVASITMPSNWIRSSASDETDSPAGALNMSRVASMNRVASMSRVADIGRRDIFTPPATEVVHLDVASRDLPAAGQAFLRLLRSKPAKMGRQVLLPSEIRPLSEALCVCLPLGDNQYTPHSVSPAFRLSDASTMKLNGKTVLYIEGDLNFQDMQISYMGIFMDGGRDSATGNEKIQEISLQGPKAELFNYRRTFKTVIASINWNN